MHEGHVKLFRKLRKAPYYQDSQYVHLWVHLLMSVNWTEKRLKLAGSDKFIDILPGQVLTSRKTLTEETGIQTSKVERILKALESEQQLEQQTFTKYRVISITNWSQYQHAEQQNEQQMNNKRTTDEQQMNTKKKVKKEKNINPSLSVEIPDWIPLKDWNDFLAMRTRIKKPLSVESYHLAFSKLEKLKASGCDPSEVLQQSTFSNWQGLFEVKKNQLQSPQPQRLFN